MIITDVIKLSIRVAALEKDLAALKASLGEQKAQEKAEPRPAGRYGKGS